MNMIRAIENHLPRLQISSQRQNFFQREICARWRALIGIAASVGLIFSLTINSALAADAAELSKESHAALQQLYTKEALAEILGKKAKLILVFPSITKAGFVVGGQYGEGALIKDGKTIGYYNTAGASFGLQAGAQKYGYAMFFMTEKAAQDFKSVEGFEVGVGPSVVIIDEGMAKNATTATLKDDIYAFVFGQKGLMAGIGLQGNKISKIDK